MSFEARLRQAFERATDVPAVSAEEVLVGLIATYHTQRRQRVLILVAAAAIALGAVSFGDGAVNWLQGLEEPIPPAEKTDDSSDQLRKLEQAKGSHTIERQSAADASAPDEGTLSRGDSVLTPPAGVAGSENSVANPSNATSDDRVAGPPVGPSDERSASHPIHTRTERQNWSFTDSNGGTTNFTLANEERFIRVRLWGSGGVGTSRGIRAEVYEIVDGEAELLDEFCTVSGLLAVTAGAEIEVRAIEGGCDGKNFTVKGTASMRFYR